MAVLMSSPHPRLLRLREGQALPVGEGILAFHIKICTEHYCVTRNLRDVTATNLLQTADQFHGHQSQEAPYLPDRSFVAGDNLVARLVLKARYTPQSGYRAN